MENGKNKNALVIRPGSLGDLILTIPVFLSLKKNGFDVYLIGNEKINQFLEEKGIIKKGIGFGDARLTEFFTRTKKFVISEFPDFSLVISYIEGQNKFSQNLLLTFGNRVIFHSKLEQRNYHITDHLLQPLKKLKLMVYYPEVVERRHENIFFIHPGSGSKKKNWKKEYFLEIFYYLRAKCECKVILGVCETSDYEYWKENMGGQNLIVPENITDLSRKLETGRYFIGNDSGVSHMAAFLGLKTFIIFGPTDPKIWAPRTNNVRIIKTNVDCSPCEEKRNRCSENICLQKIEPGYVITLLENEKRW